MFNFIKKLFVFENNSCCCHLSPEITLKVKRLTETAKLPEKKLDSDVGFDLFADEEVVIPAGMTKRIKSGIAVEIPEGIWIQVEGRSGLASKGIQPLGGIVDNGYRGDVSVLLLNSSSNPYQVMKGDKIAQFVLREIVPIHKVEEIKEFSAETERGDKGFGSSGR